MRYGLFVFFLFPFMLNAQNHTDRNSDSAANAAYKRAYADSVFRNLPCYKQIGCGVPCLFKNGRITHKGQFEHWKLMCGLEYIYDPEGNLIAIKVYEDGVFTREIPVPDR